MYAKLALSNIKKSAKDFTVYFMTLVLGVTAFYLFNSLNAQSASMGIEGRRAVATLANTMHGLTVLLAIVLGFLMLYANNYLVKRRKKELGLYQVLGMNRIQVSRVLFLETFFASGLSLFIGLGLGVFLSQFMSVLTAKLFRETQVNYTFVFSFDAMLFTVVCFALIFVVMLLFNIRELRRVQLVDLMSAHKKNEKVVVKNKYVVAVMFVSALAMIGIAYWRLDQHGYVPLFGSDSLAFTLTTLLVFVGTVLFFMSFASAFLLLSQTHKRSYFKGLNMFTVRQFAAKVNSATASMIAICVLLFLMISSVTFGMSLASSMEQAMRENVPYDVSMTLYTFDKEKNPTPPNEVLHLLKDSGLDLDKQCRVVNAVALYLSPIPGGASSDGESRYLSISDIAQAYGLSAPGVFKTSSDSVNGPSIQIQKKSDYVKTCQIFGVKPIDIKPGHYLISVNMGRQLANFYNEGLRQNKSLNVFGQTLQPAQDHVVTGPVAVTEQSSMGMNSGTIIVDDAVVPKDAPTTSMVINCLTKPGVSSSSLVDAIDQWRKARGTGDCGSYFLAQWFSKESIASSLITLLASVSYISVYIGWITIMSCATIISIQQLSNAIDAKPSYGLLRHLGCSQKLCNKSLLKQMLMYFALPLILACIHSFVALSKLFDTVKGLFPLELTGVAVVVVSVFMGVYVLYFLGTYSLSKSIVSKS